MSTRLNLAKDSMVPFMTPAEVHVWFRLPQQDGWPPHDREPVDAVADADGTYRLIRTPAYASGVARGDRVAVTERDGDLWVTAVVADAGNWASRVVPFRPLEADHVLASFADLACDPWVTRIGVVVLEIDGRVDPDPVIEELFRGRPAGEWDFDLSVVTDSPALSRPAAH